MNILFGKYKGRKLIELKDSTLKPTMSMIKKNIFNLVDVKNKVMLDLFAGSGAVSFEALSIGAKKVIAVEKKHDYVNLINKNFESFFKSENFEVFRTDYRVALSRAKDKFDFIFVDPPHGQIDYYKKTIELVEEYDLLNDDGIVMFESKLDITTLPQFQPQSEVVINDKKELVGTNLVLKSVRKYSGIYISVYKKEANKKVVTKTSAKKDVVGKTVVFAGSFDPMHVGHERIIDLALAKFPKLIILVASNDDKDHKLVIEDRYDLVSDFVKKHYKGKEDLIEVMMLEEGKLTTDFLKEHKLTKLVRGIRSEKDLAYEKVLFDKYRATYKEVEVEYITTELANISSSNFWKDPKKFNTDLPKEIWTKLKRVLGK